MTDGHDDHTDARTKKNQLEVGATNQETRVSVSEPQSAPPGHKVLATAMEVGLVRDVVGQVIILHGALLDNGSVVGKTYTFCFETVGKGLSITESAITLARDVFKETFPNIIVQRTLDAHLFVWEKWVDVDGTVATKVENQLQYHPFFRKSSMEIIQDWENSLKETKVWKFGTAVTEKVQDLVNKIRHPKNDSEETPEGEDKTETGPKDDLDSEKSSSRKRRARGQTKGASNFRSAIESSGSTEGGNGLQE